MRNSISFSRNIETRATVDVFVAGGGPAGLAAAVTAARQGCSVFLAEAQTCLGGMGTAGMLPLFMPFGDGANFYAGGFGRELFNRLETDGGTHSKLPLTAMMPVINAEGLKRIYDNVMKEAGVAFTLGTQVIAVESTQKRVSHVVCAAKSGIFAVQANMFIDGTGDGDLAAWAGAAFEKGDDEGHMMGGTLCSLWAGIDWETVKKPEENAFESRRTAEQVLIEHLRRDPSILPQVDPHLPGMWKTGQTTGGGNIGHSYGVDGTDERSMTQACVYGRELLPHYERFYKEHLKGFEAMELVYTAPLFGIRETRRIIGDYVLCRSDYDAHASFDDEIGRYHYWIDTHLARPNLDDFEEHKKLRNNQPKRGESYGIPYRILTPKNLENVLVAGRCVSCDRAVQSSIRVMPGCFITGQAAGMAASLAVEGNTHTRGIDVHRLQERLRAYGAYLPHPAV